MSIENIRRWLDKQWRDILSESSEPDPDIDRFVNSEIVSLRYAFVTQLLGKAADHSRSLLSLQSGDGTPGSWNARSLADQIVVPWVTHNQNVLGTSREPYASKPLRRPSLSSDMSNVRNPDEWKALVDFFENLDKSEPARVQETFRKCLQSLARRLETQNFEYPTPSRVSMASLIRILNSFLSESSHGLRPHVIATALFRVLGDAFSLFGGVHAQGLNESDSPSGMPGDIACFGRDNRNVILAVEVKDRDLTLTDLHATITKVRQGNNDLSSVLFSAPRLRKQEEKEIKEEIESAWNAGLNVYQSDIQTFVKTTFALLDEQYRIVFLKEIGKELDTHGEYRHREAWRILLESTG